MGRAALATPVFITTTIRKHRNDHTRSNYEWLPRRTCMGYLWVKVNAPSHCGPGG
jgi:hypothetical protein